MAKFIGMGDYYTNSNYGLVKVVCRAYDAASKEPLICYSKIGKGGTCSEVFSMPEVHFKGIFLPS